MGWDIQGWGGLCRGREEWIMQGWGGLCRDKGEWVMQGWVGYVGLGWVL